MVETDQHLKGKNIIQLYKSKWANIHIGKQNKALKYQLFFSTEVFQRDYFLMADRTYF